MKTTFALFLTILTGIAFAQEIDPGWSRRAEYIAETGDTNCNYAAVMAWERAEAVKAADVAAKAEDARIAKLPSLAAIVAENAALRQKLDAAEAKLATVQATADKAAADVAALKEVPKPVEPVK